MFNNFFHRIWVFLKDVLSQHDKQEVIKLYNKTVLAVYVVVDKQRENISMDFHEHNPLEYFNSYEHLKNHIFKHLTFKETLKLSVTCKYNRCSVFNSDRFRNNVKAIVKNDKNQVELFLNSSTIFNNLLLLLENLPVEDVCKITTKYSNLKSLELRGGRGKLGALENLNEVQEIYFDRIDDDHISKKYEVLRKVKTLKVNQCNKNVVWELISCCEQLESLTLTGVSETNHLLLKLSKLSSFELKKLRFTEFSKYNFCHEKTELQEFLRTQRNTLEVLKLHIWAGVPVLKLIFTMPKLNELRLDELAKCDPETDWNLEFPVSNTITKLRLQDFKNNKDILACILKSCPNTKHLKIYSNNAEIIEVIKMYGKNVETFGEENISRRAE